MYKKNKNEVCELVCEKERECAYKWVMASNSTGREDTRGKEGDLKGGGKQKE